MEIVKIDHKEFGIEEQKAKQIRDLFKPMLDKMVDLEERANNVFSLPMGPEAYAKARELRLEYKNTRTGTDKIHKKIKAFYLQGGRFVDGLKNAQLMASQGMEEKLAAIENHEAIEKQRKIDELQEKRAKSLRKFDLEVVPDTLGEMDKASWDNYFTGTKVNYEKRVAAEEKAEEERLRQEKIDRLTTSRKTEAAKYSDLIPDYETIKWGEIKDDVYQKLLQKASDAHKAKLEQEEKNKAELEKLKKEAEEREAKEAKEREAREAELKKEREAREAKLKKEREAREKAEMELKAKREEEALREQKEKERIEAELNQDDAGKVKSLVGDLEKLAQKYTFKSNKNQKMYNNVGILIGKIITYIHQ